MRSYCARHSNPSLSALGNIFSFHGLFEALMHGISLYFALFICTYTRWLSRHTCRFETHSNSNSNVIYLGLERSFLVCRLMNRYQLLLLVTHRCSEWILRNVAFSEASLIDLCMYYHVLVIVHVSTYCFPWSTIIQFLLQVRIRIHAYSVWLLVTQMNLRHSFRWSKRVLAIAFGEAKLDDLGTVRILLLVAQIHLRCFQCFRWSKGVLGIAFGEAKLFVHALSTFALGEVNAF